MSDSRTPPTVTITVDVEDHIAGGDPQRRFEANTRRILESMERKGVRGTFFVVGELARRAPTLIREIAAAGHEVGCHGWTHRPLDRLEPATFREALHRAKGELEACTGTPVEGFRAPVFSLVPATRWAVDELREAGFRYSSSVLPAANPLYGDPTAPSHPFVWENGLIELPCPLLRLGGVTIPYLGGIYFRYLPTRLTLGKLRATPPDAILWSYVHPYDIDHHEPLRPIAGASRLTSLLLWLNRRPALAKLERLMDLSHSAPLSRRVADARIDNRLPRFSTAHPTPPEAAPQR